MTIRAGHYQAESSAIDVELLPYSVYLHIPTATLPIGRFAAATNEIGSRIAQRYDYTFNSEDCPDSIVSVAKVNNLDVLATSTCRQEFSTLAVTVRAIF